MQQCICPQGARAVGGREEAYARGDETMRRDDAYWGAARLVVGAAGAVDKPDYGQRAELVTALKIDRARRMEGDRG